MHNLIVHINRTALKINTKEHTQQYNVNLQQYTLVYLGQGEVTESLVQSFIKSGADFWINIENLNPYNKHGMIMIGLSFNYIGTNKFYGYITTEFYNNLLETFGGC